MRTRDARLGPRVRTRIRAIRSDEQAVEIADRERTSVLETASETRDDIGRAAATAQEANKSIVDESVAHVYRAALGEHGRCRGRARWRTPSCAIEVVLSNRDAAAPPSSIDGGAT